MSLDLVRALAPLHGTDPRRMGRAERLVERLRAEGLRPAAFASAPGRTELAGNHTDHNHGRVLAAAVDLDALAVVAPREDDRVVVRSEGFDGTFEVDLSAGLDPVAGDQGTTTALIRGVAAGLRARGFHLGGFQAWIGSDVLTGSGLSSSAAIEVLLGSIFSGLYNGNAVPAETLALVGQEAENRHFGKPCGLMDQMASALGGVVAIDFEKTAAPRVERVPLRLDGLAYRLAVVDTGGSHADLTEDYAAIPRDMKAIAGCFGQDTLRGLTVETLLGRAPELRAAFGDRAFLRSLHFVRENERVVGQVEALKRDDLEAFLRLVRDSGLSSFRWLQNIVPVGAIQDQGVALALALTEDFLGGKGACRVHGGGFAGTIQAWIPVGQESRYEALLAPVFGPACVNLLSIRPMGATFIPLLEGGHS